MHATVVNRPTHGCAAALIRAMHLDVPPGLQFASVTALVIRTPPEWDMHTMWLDSGRAARAKRRSVFVETVYFAQA